VTVADVVARLEAEIEHWKGQMGGMQDRVDLAALRRHTAEGAEEFKVALAEQTAALAELNRLTKLRDELLEG
jgi:hypothetical protein